MTLNAPLRKTTLTTRSMSISPYALPARLCSNVESETYKKCTNEFSKHRGRKASRHSFVHTRMHPSYVFLPWQKKVRYMYVPVYSVREYEKKLYFMSLRHDDE